jgi:hypothetical protein
MAEREVEVTAASGRRLSLRLLGDQCDGCQGGCAGRCNLFATTDAGEFEFDAPAGVAVRAGERYRLALDDEGLRRAAWQGYGLALLGLLLGALLGYAAGSAWPAARDGLTLAGLLSGTFLAVRRSKRQLPAPRLLPAGGAPPLSCKSDRP